MKITMMIVMMIFSFLMLADLKGKVDSYPKAFVMSIWILLAGTLIILPFYLLYYR